MRRELIKVAEDMLSSAFEAAVDSAPREQIQHAEQLLYEIAETGRYGGGFETFETALDSAIDRAAQAYESDGKLSGLATGLKDLDARLGGLQPTDLIVIAGRPGMGKTALATNIAFNVARAYDSTRQVDGALQPGAGGIVAFFSLEMSSEQLATRVLAEQAEISSSNIRRGEIGETEFTRLLDHRQKMRRLPLSIDYTPDGKKQTLEQIAFYLENARCLREGLGAAGFSVFGGVHAPYLWMRTPSGLSSWDFFDRLLTQSHIVGTPGSGFGPNGEGYFRLSAFKSRDNVNEAIARIRRAFGSA